MKKVVVLLLAVIILAGLCTSVCAANVANGFFNIGTKENIVITPYKVNSKVSSFEVDVDGDSKADTWYIASNRLKVSYTVADNEGYYGVLLVEGSSLPTSDNAIFYVDQVAPKSNVVEFDVYPLLPETEGDGKKITALTLYISCSKEGAGLVSIPLSYVIGAEVDSSIQLHTAGDVNEDGAISAFDRVALSRYVAKWTGYGPDEEGKNKVNLDAADVFTGGVAGVVTAQDRVVLARYIAKWVGYENLPMSMLP